MAQRKGNAPTHVLCMLLTLDYVYIFIVIIISNMIRCHTGEELLMCQKAHEA